MSRSTRTDDGLGLIEVIIAMVLLAVLALAVLPLLISAMGLSVDNRSSVVATNLANDRIAEIRSVFPTGSAASHCADLAAKSGDLPDPSGSGMTIRTSAVTCPTGAAEYPAAVTVTVQVISAGEPLTSVSTKVMVAKQ
ncbi:prepilin-type N-terminal cleavage/methylation domain-containing protein [Microbacterium sp. NPDC077644]|uniref:prepilin-type N-terminal cleavage/methylation domain-containing protein n=1 Tax=Microbacterium sp. NPDC077644 TaxID=3155055 RepID=UPI00344C552A